MTNKEEVRAYVNVQLIMSKAETIANEAAEYSHIKMLAEEIVKLCAITIKAQ